MSADHDYNQGRAGWYVVDHDTQIAVGGPYQNESQAETERLAITNPDALRVYEVTEAIA